MKIRTFIATASQVASGSPVATVKGALTTESAFGTHLEKSNLKAVNATEGFVYAVDSMLGGNVSTETGELYVSGSTLSASLTGDSNQYTDVYDSTVKGALTSSGNAVGGVFCASEVYGAAKYAGNSDNLQIGGEGLLGSCAGASYFGGDVEVTDSTANAVLDNAIVRGGLTATGNNPVLVVGELAPRATAPPPTSSTSGAPRRPRAA
ncbi:hypothetical protein [Streptomyces atratus]|uniref:hypothetical protein n=1 Tax=Streptomyces atratus TaxID=1893 RepID=UPI0033C5545E